MQHNMADFFGNMYPIYMLVYAGGCSYFYTRLSEEFQLLSYVNIVTAGLVVVLPIFPLVTKMADRCCSIKVKPLNRGESKRYSAARYTLLK